jgi:hypothetical protein
MTTQVNVPRELRKDSSGNLYFLDTPLSGVNAILRKLDQSGNVTTITQPYSGGDYIAPDSLGNVYTTAYLQSEGGWGFAKINQAGNFTGITLDLSQVPELGDISAFRNSISGMSYRTSDSCIYTTHSTANIYKINPQGVVTLFVTIDATPTPILTFLDFDSNDNMVIIDALGAKIFRADSSGVIVSTAVYTAGNINNTFAIDASNNIYTPGNAVVYKFDTSNIETIIAGTFGQSGFADGASALFSFQTWGIAVVNGNIYVTDAANYRIRKVVYSEEVYTTFTAAGDGTPGLTDTGGGGAPCFLEGTRILCKEGYLPVETLVPGTLVKTSLNGYKKIVLIGSGLMENPDNEERLEQRLYKLSTSNYPELEEDLFITGCHSRLVRELTDKEKEETEKHIERVFVTDKQYRLMACVDKKAEPWNSKGQYTIWHFALENEDIMMNYGVYANGGLLVETCCLDTLKNKSNFVLTD